MVFLGEYPSLCVRSMHAVRTQCKHLALVRRTPYPGGVGWVGGWVGESKAFFSGFWEALTPPPWGGGGGIFLGAGFESLGTHRGIANFNTVFTL